jgi:protocatechuate 3,4-dioxygenase alpha subunit
MSELVPTPGQTVGPFFGLALPYAGDAQLVPPGRPDAVQLAGRLLDGAGQPVPDALVEIWQRDSDGAVATRSGSLDRDGRTFTGWGRAATDSAGRYCFSTLLPVARDGGAAFFAVVVFARGLTNRLFTRAYLPDDAPALERDRLLSGLAPERRRTLIAQRAGNGLQFDIRLQGDGETVFLRYPAHPPR